MKVPSSASNSNFSLVFLYLSTKASVTLKKYYIKNTTEEIIKDDFVKKIFKIDLKFMSYRKNFVKDLTELDELLIKNMIEDNNNDGNDNPKFDDILRNNETIITNSRHYDALLKAFEEIQKVKYGLDTGISSDLMAIDIRSALYFFGEITGEVTNDELLGNIFANFCIGK